MVVFANDDNKSVLLRFVESVVGRLGRAWEAINQHFNILVGDRHDADIWDDDWMGRGPLRVCFLRIFALASLKMGSVVNFGL